MTYSESIIAGTPTPAIVLALGQMAAEAAGDMESVFLRGDSRRAAVTRFLALQWKKDGELTLGPISQGAMCCPPATSRREAGEMIASSARKIQSPLERALRDMRTHECLAQAGLGDVLSPPLDFVLIADVADPAPSGALVPLMAICDAVLAAHQDSQGHLLLSVATFSDDEEDQAFRHACVYASLKELNTLFSLEDQGARKHLAQFLGLERITPWQFRTYLFDHRKEGTREVKDRHELRVIMGNFLLALLSGGMARELGRDLPLAEIHEQCAYFSSAAATALIFEPEPLISACASRMGAEFIEAETGNEAAADPRLADDLASDLDGHLGGVRDWMERVCTDTPCELRDTNGDMEIGLHFTGFRFERIPKEAWAEAIVNYDSMYRQMQQPRHQARIEQNAKTLAEERLFAQEASIESLPQTVWLYPDGIRNSVKALKQLDDRLADRGAWLERFTRPPLRNMEADIEQLEDAAWGFPDVPAFIARLLLVCLLEAYLLIGLGNGLAQSYLMAEILGGILAGLVCVITALAMGFWLQRKDRRLIALRDRCIRNSEQQQARILDIVARQHLIGLCQTLRDQTETAIQDLNGLESTLNETRALLQSRWESYLRQLGVSHGQNGAFRQTPTDEKFTRAIYARWRQTPQAMRSPMLEAHRWLADWRDATAESLATRLVEYGETIFAPVREISIEEILANQPNEDVRPMLLRLARDAVPLLRADFDRLGGGREIVICRHALVADPDHSQMAPVWEANTSGCQAIATGDPYIIAYSHVRHLIPLGALRDLLGQTYRAYVRANSKKADQHLSKNGLPCLTSR